MTMDSHRLAQAMCRPGGRVLDVGCGRGEVARRFVDIGCEVTGLDIDPAAVDAMAELGLVAHACDLDSDELGPILGSNVFDVIVCLDVLEHTKDPGAVLGRLLEYLDPDGDVIISLPNVTHGDVRLTLLDGKFEYRNEGLLDATHLRFFDRRAVEELVAKSGLEIRELHPVIMELGSTELRVELDAVADELVDRIQADPESTIYQWVFRSQRSAATDRRPPFAPLLDELAEVRAAQLGAEAYAAKVEDQLRAQVSEQAEVKGYVAKLESELRERDAHIRDVAAQVATDAARQSAEVRGAEEDLSFVQRELDARGDVIQLITDENDHIGSQLAEQGAQFAAVSAELHAVKSRRLYRLLNLISRWPIVRSLAR